LKRDSFSHHSRASETGIMSAHDEGSRNSRGSNSCSGDSKGTGSGNGSPHEVNRQPVSISAAAIEASASMPRLEKPNSPSERVLDLVLKGKDLPVGGLTSGPLFFQASVLLIHGGWQVVYRSEYVADGINPQWNEAFFSIDLMLARQIRIAVWARSESEDVPIGSFEATIIDLLNTAEHVLLDEENNQVGTISVLKASLRNPPEDISTASEIKNNIPLRKYREILTPQTPI